MTWKVRATTRADRGYTTRQFGADHDINHKDLRVFFREQGYGVGMGRYYAINPATAGEVAADYRRWKAAGS